MSKSYILLKNIFVYGIDIDRNTRCIHYNSEQDVIAIKFKCCGKYYSCYKCHNEFESHKIIRWLKEEFDKKAIICGVCGCELTINQYIISESVCPNCDTKFNPNCRKHFHIYFEFVSDKEICGKD